VESFDANFFEGSEGSGVAYDGNEIVEDEAKDEMFLDVDNGGRQVPIGELEANLGIPLLGSCSFVVQPLEGISPRTSVGSDGGEVADGVSDGGC